jgi:signal transduction histidine kinase
MNGKVDVESKEGEGSTFRLWIPVKAEFSEKSKIIKK